MSALGERTLLQHLLDADSLAVIAEEAMVEVIPTDEMRVIVDWAVAYYYRSGCKQAPSLDAIRAQPINGVTFGNLLDDHEVPIGDDPGDTVEWAIEDLRSSYVHRVAMNFNKRFATEMSGAEGSQRVDVLGEFANELVGLSVRTASKAYNVDLRTGIADRLRAYDSRAEQVGKHFGLHFGLPMVDEHTLGVHPGELAILGAGPKVGKSYMMDWIALKEWEAGRAVALFTLENAVSMGLDRIACLACRVDPFEWQRGQCDSDEIEKVREWQFEVAKADVPLWVLQPDLGKRSFEHMVREANLREADSLLIDQLTFVETEDPLRPHQALRIQIGNALHRLKGMISTGHRPLPCVVAHQLSRDGMRMAFKRGYHEMYDFAEAAEIERTADHALAMYASPDHRVSHRMLLQMLGARRIPLKHWLLDWQIEKSIIDVRQETKL